jgi:hypothetical protein
MRPRVSRAISLAGSARESARVRIAASQRAGSNRRIVPSPSWRVAGRIRPMHVPSRPRRY